MGRGKYSMKPSTKENIFRMLIIRDNQEEISTVQPARVKFLDLSQ